MNADKNPDLIPRSSALLIILSLICSVSALAQSTRKPQPKPQAPANAEADFDRFVKLADEARLAERFDDAISLYGQALKVKPKWAEGWWYIGAIFYQRDIYPQARDAFQNLVALEPERGPAWAMFGLCLFQTADYEQAGVALGTQIHPNRRPAAELRNSTAPVRMRSIRLRAAPPRCEAAGCLARRRAASAVRPE